MASSLRIPQRIEEMKARFLIILALALISGTSQASAQITKPDGKIRPLLPTRIWTRAADGKTIEAEALHVRDGQVVISDNQSRWFTIPISSLIKEDQDLLDTADDLVVGIPLGYLLRQSKDNALVLLGRPDQSYAEGDMWNVDLPAGNFISLSYDAEGKVSNISISFWEGDLDSLLRWFGLSSAIKGSTTMAGAHQNTKLKVNGFPEFVAEAVPSPGGFGPVNLRM